MTRAHSKPSHQPDVQSLINIEKEVAEMGVRVSYALAERVAESKYPGCLNQEIDRLVDYLEKEYSIETLKENPIIKAYRSFYWRLGIDPTKIRPSSEALVRRILRSKKFPRISLVVDAGNIASAKTLVPIGVYDLDKTSPPLTIKLSSGGEEFTPIGGAPETLPSRIPILIDSSGVVMHLYPYRDSVKTMVDESTRRVVVIGAGVPGVADKLLVEAVDLTVRLAERCGWARLSETILKP
ncbi:MAG: phenylalanine--tRNA ligase beta subunit-related protein [Acidilobaceae archaeon]